MAALRSAGDGRVPGSVPGPDSDGEPLAVALNRANERWVDETAFLSPALLVDLLGLTSRLVDAMWQGTDRQALGEGVSWAGVDPAPVWLDLAREYAESWSHQQPSRSPSWTATASSPGP